MKKLAILVIFLFVYVFTTAQQNLTCSNAQMICPNPTGTYTAGVNLGNAQAGPYYGCLGSQPNPSWYYMHISTGGNLDLLFSGTYDIDYVCWGPFISLASVCSSLTAGSIAGCSYSGSNTETLSISNTNAGEYYLILITNFSNIQNTISVSQTGGTALVNCNNLFLNAAPVCQGDTTTINCSSNSLGSPGYTIYPGGFTDTIGSFPVAPLASTDYTVFYSGANWQNQTVTISSTINITPLPNPTLVPYVSTPTICLGQSATLSINGAVSYTWSTGIANLTSIIVSPTLNTTYTVEGAAANGCKDTAQIAIQVENCTGLKEFKTKSVHLHPNPVIDYLMIESQNFDIRKIEILNVQGIICHSLHAETRLISVDCSDLSKGLYLIIIYSDDARLVKRIIKD